MRSVSMLMTNSLRRSPGSCISSWRRSSPQPRPQFHQLGCRSIRADLPQRRKGNDHAWVTIPTQHPTRIAHLHDAKDSPYPPRRVVLDRPKTVAIRADPTKERIRLRLRVHDRALQRRHDGLAVIHRQAEVAVKQTFPARR